ncbi:MAG: CDP-alcohol phosphatidyltransferase family protein [Proteobacteria bacterium]|nr:CDP-alcohol phosphatidyltransferase family protein [Pseudomonadota bacterium]
MINIPNTLTLMRIIAVPIFLAMMVEDNYETAMWVFLAAGATDGLDGAVARLTNSKTNLGAHLDPLADKLLLVSSFLVLGILGWVPMWLMILVIVRDSIILGGFIFSAVLVGHSIPMAPSMAGKVTTFTQLLLVSLVLLNLAGWIAIGSEFFLVCFGVTGVATAGSGIDYVRQGLNWYSRELSGD